VWRGSEGAGRLRRTGTGTVARMRRYARCATHVRAFQVTAKPQSHRVRVLRVFWFHCAMVLRGCTLVLCSLVRGSLILCALDRRSGRREGRRLEKAAHEHDDGGRAARCDGVAGERVHCGFPLMAWSPPLPSPPSNAQDAPAPLWSVPISFGRRSSPATAASHKPSSGTPPFVLKTKVAGRDKESCETPLRAASSPGEQTAPASTEE